MTNGLDYLFEEGLLKEGDTDRAHLLRGRVRRERPGRLEVRSPRSTASRSSRRRSSRPTPDMSCPGHPVQGGRRQRDRPHRGARPDGLGRGGRRGAGAGRARSSATTRSSRPALLEGPAGRVAEEEPLVASPVSSVRRARRPAEGLPGQVPRRAQPGRRVRHCGCDRDEPDPGQGLRERRPDARGGQQGQGVDRRRRHRRTRRALWGSRPASRRAWRATSSGPPTCPAGRSR